MSKPRMAGEKLDEPTKESADAKKELSRSARNKQIREEIGNDPERMAQRISGVDREAYDFDGYTDKQINMAMQGEKFDENDYARLTGKPIGGDKPEPKPETSKPETPVEDDPVVTLPSEPPTGTPDPAPTPGPTQGITLPGFGEGKFSQYINQDNDITSSVTGDNNTVTNEQDNSINAYSGDAQSFANDYVRKFTKRFA